jgi:hypothetical protein
MIMPNPSVLDRLIQDRHEELRAIPRRLPPAPSGVRVRVGHVLIAAGIAISGERLLEQPARPSALPRAA